MMTNKKSWVLTISTMVASVIIQFLAGPLNSIGIEITEAQLLHIFILPIITVAAGVFSAAHKRKTNSTSPPQHEEKLSDQVALKGEWYQTNMESDATNGNVIKYGDPYLYAKIKDVKSYTTAQLWKGDNLIQVEQSKAGEPVRLELFEKKDGKVVPMSKGTYHLVVSGDRGTSDRVGIKDEFQII